jgi:hypothetical protein
MGLGLACPAQQASFLFFFPLCYRWLLEDFDVSVSRPTLGRLLFCLIALVLSALLMIR